MLILELVGGEYRLAICYGDEQFVSRLLSLIMQEGEAYGNILPFPGIFSSSLFK